VLVACTKASEGPAHTLSVWVGDCIQPAGEAGASKAKPCNVALRLCILPCVWGTITEPCTVAWHRHCTTIRKKADGTTSMPRHPLLDKHNAGSKRRTLTTQESITSTNTVRVHGEGTIGLHSWTAAESDPHYAQCAVRAVYACGELCWCTYIQ
jgi:hypothetical protein